jgi:hypothetical protein
MKLKTALLLTTLFAGTFILTTANTCKSRINDGLNCLSTDQCLTTSYCHSEKQICTPLPRIDQPCGDGVYCANNLGCSTETGLCQNLPSAGGKCLLGERGPYLCSSGLVCYSGVCDALKNSINAPCSDFTNLCGTGLGCDFSGTESLCKISKTIRQPCAANTPGACAAGLYCSVYTGKCESLLKEGSSCKDSVECRPGLTCIYQTTLYFFKTLKCSKIPSTVGSQCSDVCAGGLSCSSMT